MIARNTLSLLPPVAVAPKHSRAWNTVSLLPPVAMAPKLPRYSKLSGLPLAQVPWLSVGLRQASSIRTRGGLWWCGSGGLGVLSKTAGSASPAPRKIKIFARHSGVSPLCFSKTRTGQEIGSSEGLSADSLVSKTLVSLLKNFITSELCHHRYSFIAC